MVDPEDIFKNNATFESNPPNFQLMAEGLATISEAMDQIRETANGVRAKFIEDGYNETAAEQCALHFYMTMVTKMMEWGGPNVSSK